MRCVNATRHGQGPDTSKRTRPATPRPDASDASGPGRSERRADVMQTAAELFAQKGFRATTVREIADAAGILSGSLYHHFDSKESIGDEILSSFINDVLGDYRAAVSEAGPPRAVLEQIVRTTSSTLSRLRAALDARLTYRLLRDVLWIPSQWRTAGGYTSDQVADGFLQLLFEGIAARLDR